jgi:hypothetical protein
MALELVWTAGAEADLLNLHQQLFELLSGDEDLISKVFEAPLQSSLQLLRDIQS